MVLGMRGWPMVRWSMLNLVLLIAAGTWAVVTVSMRLAHEPIPTEQWLMLPAVVAAVIKVMRDSPPPDDRGEA